MIDRPIHAKPPSPTTGDREARAFERWVREDLVRQYGKAKDEAVPAEWLRLILDA